MNYIDVWFQSVDNQFAGRSRAFGSQYVNSGKVQAVDAAAISDVVCEIVVQVFGGISFKESLYFVIPFFFGEKLSVELSCNHAGQINCRLYRTSSIVS